MEVPESQDAWRSDSESRIFARLAGIENICGREIDAPSLALALKAGPLPVDRLLALAGQLARTLANVHRCGVVHGNISPSTILLRPADGAALLAGFDLATSIPEERPVFTHHREIRGQLAYIAPEQSGRTGRAVDFRADLYSLGVVLYEAATGDPPFPDQDPLQQLHDHLATVPRSPSHLRSDLPRSLSEAILRLLEKDPESRYQSAGGLAHDIACIRKGAGERGQPPLVLGTHDFPMRLAPPARLLGRENEIAALSQALDSALIAGPRMAFVSGVPGVGKTSLVNELRTLVTARRGWFISGKFDQYRQDAPTAPTQAFRALGRLLLAEPEAEWLPQRKRLLRELGAHAELVCRLPEFAVLLGPQPEAPHVEPEQAEARLLSAAVALLRGTVSAARPLVMVLDDFQWGGPVSAHFLEAVAGANDLPGLLIVGVYRVGDLEVTHPLKATLARLTRDAAPPLILELANLPADGVRELLGEMMHLSGERAASLAVLVSEIAGGNPFDTVELLNALRRDATLRLGPQGWEWDAAAVRRYIGHRSVVDLIGARLARLSEPCQQLLRAISCLGGKVPLGLLRTATGVRSDELDELLAIALEEGFVEVDREPVGGVSMRHDRVQQAVYAGATSIDRGVLHLQLARRLVDHPEFRSAAAQQYLAAVDDVVEAPECAAVARLLHESSKLARDGANYAAAQRMLEAALSLVSRASGRDGAAEALRHAMELDHHVLLCTLGRFDEADMVFAAIEARGAPVEEWLEAARAQLGSLNSRSRPGDAVELGLALLRLLGLDVPTDFASPEIDRRLALLKQWTNRATHGRDDRAFSGDKRSEATASLINRLSYPAYFHNLRVMAWLILEACDLWDRYGPHHDLVQLLAVVGAVAIQDADFYRTVHSAASHVVHVSEKRGWEPATSEARYHMAVYALPWRGPLEYSVSQLVMARDGMQRASDLQGASFVYRSTTNQMLDCSPSLQHWAREIEEGLKFSSRLGNEHVLAMMAVEMRILCGLRGHPYPQEGPAALARACLGRQAHMATLSLSIAYGGSLLALVFGDMPEFVRLAAAAAEHAATLTTYRPAMARIFRLLAHAMHGRVDAHSHFAMPQAEYHSGSEWLKRCAADSPENFGHLHLWLQAETAWSSGNFKLTASCFDAALAKAETLTRHWQHAVISERAGLFYLEHGLDRASRELFVRARRIYEQWGAQAKVWRMEAKHDFLHALATGGIPDPQDKAASPVWIDAIDTVAVFRAVQALSSEMNLARLQERVIDVMAALTGATAVHLVVRDDADDEWYVAQPMGPREQRMTVDSAEARSLLPLSVFHYAQRTCELVMLDDVEADARFAREPYFAGLPHCSALAVPVMSKGSLRAMLMLENRLSRGAFAAERLDAVVLIASQLAVSLENAVLYDRLEQRVQEQTRELLAAARRAGMAQVATNVLHNVGNVLNSVNVSARTLGAVLQDSRQSRVADVAALMEKNAGDLPAFFAKGGRGSQLPVYLRELARELSAEREQQLHEMERLLASVDLVNNVIAAQLSIAGASGAREPGIITELVEEALRAKEAILTGGNVSVDRDYGVVAPEVFDKSRVMQILVNLIENACHAMNEVHGERRLRVVIRQEGGRSVVAIQDTGSGIATEHLPRIFTHGFTTKPDGHGFGLHSSVMAAQEMGGALSAHSDGPGRGATFTLSLGGPAVPAVGLPEG